MPADQQLDPSALVRYCEYAFQEARRTLHNQLLAAEIGEEACHQLVLCCARNDVPRHPAAWIRTVVRRLGCKILDQPRSKETEFHDATASGTSRPHELRTHIEANEWDRRRILLRTLEPRLLSTLTRRQVRIFRLMCANWPVRRIAKHLGTGPKDIRDVRRKIITRAHSLLEGLGLPPSAPLRE